MRFPVLLAAIALLAQSLPAAEKEKLYLDPIDVHPKPIRQDPTVKYDFDIVYVRAHRAGDTVQKAFYMEIARPVYMQPGADLMLLHPDGSEELLVNGGDKGAVQDPIVSFDGQWVYYSLFYDLTKGGQFEVPPGGADIYKINLKSRKIVQLTRQIYTPNTGAAPAWTADFRQPAKGNDNGKFNWLSYGVYNTGPCQLPGGRVMFTSSRNAFRPPKHPAPVLQLFVMDDVDESAQAERNVQEIGFLNVALALHPVVLTDGRVMFSTLEGQGLRSDIEWGLWAIHPDGTAWSPLLSAFRPGGGAPDAFHFQAQLSDRRIVAEEYYNQNNSGFGTYFVFPLKPENSADGYAMGPAWTGDPRNPPLREGRFSNGRGKYSHLAFSPQGIEALTPFTHGTDGPADSSIPTEKTSPGVGKFTHPSAAPDNNLLTIWSPGPTNHQYTYNPQLNGGICLIKGGKPLEEPGQMCLIKLDPAYNCQWPRAVVTYKRIYGIDAPAKLADLANDGKLSPELPEGTPFGIVGTSSLYKRESFPRGGVPQGSVTASFIGEKHDNSVRNGYNGLELFNAADEGTLNWKNQGADAGLYSNDQIHAIRILAMEPATDRHGPKGGKLFYNFAQERLRILGEIPVRKFDKDGKQPLDPDGNPDTSFAAKIPADTPFTFQTLDKDGMVLNMAQTWHQVRPGEVRTNCGGCHAHSQEPTPFEKTAAAGKDYALFDLTRSTPLLTDAAHDAAHRKVDAEGETGLRYEPSVKNVEYWRDVRPILQRSCAACHTGKWEQQMGMLVLDDDSPVKIENSPNLPNTYARLASDHSYKSKWGYKPLWNEGRWCFPNASRYVRMFQSRRSLLVWKILGRRTDGWSNDDHPTETTPGDPTTLQWHGQPLAPTRENFFKADLDYTGAIMPPPEAVAGTYAAPDGTKIKVAPLTDEDKRTIIRWIDLGCPIDFDYNPDHPEARGYGWMGDDTRPTLSVTLPKPNINESFSRIVIGACDYFSGLDEKSLSAVATFDIDGIPAGQDLASRFKNMSPGVWELKLGKTVSSLGDNTLTISIKDKAGNITRVERKFSVVIMPSRVKEGTR